eukprot:GHVU01085291.1.p1 GENE.GHVU01085291.1~~GHVU01085291.1.p1  ORF type:complete len:126 (-),score=11.31 GHVU01085291.1:147-524(-)
MMNDKQEFRAHWDVFKVIEAEIRRSKQEPPLAHLASSLPRVQPPRAHLVLSASLIFKPKKSLGRMPIADMNKNIVLLIFQLHRRNGSALTSRSETTTLTTDPDKSAAGASPWCKGVLTGAAIFEK